MMLSNTWMAGGLMDNRLLASLSCPQGQLGYLWAIAVVDRLADECLHKAGGAFQGTLLRRTAEGLPLGEGPQ